MGKDDDRVALNQIYVERLFLHVLRDLYERRGRRYLYERLNCGRLLRQLLLDGDVLCNLAKRRVGVPLRFVVIEYGERPPGVEEVPEAMKSFTISSPGPGAYFHPMKIDQYLSHRVANHGDEWITVKDVIRYVANNYGGVHLDPGKVDKRKMHRLDQMVSINGEGAVFALLSPIVDTALAALFPLRDALLAKLSADGIEVAMDQERRMVEGGVPGGLDQDRGTVSFWLKSDKEPQWYLSSENKLFPPMQNGSFRIQVSKIGTKLRLDVEGIFGGPHCFEALMPGKETIAPEHGVHVFLSWDRPTIRFCLQGKEVEVRGS